MTRANELDTLHAVVVERANGLFEAQLIELDLAVSADSEQGLIEELEYAIELEYRIAKDHNKTPFANLFMAPDRFHEGREPADFDDWGVIKLPAEVAEALAVALHTPSSIGEFKLKELKKAA